MRTKSVSVSATPLAQPVPPPLKREEVGGPLRSTFSNHAGAVGSRYTQPLRVTIVAPRIKVLKTCDRAGRGEVGHEGDGLHGMRVDWERVRWNGWGGVG